MDDKDWRFRAHSANWWDLLVGSGEFFHRGRVMFRGLLHCQPLLMPDACIRQVTKGCKVEVPLFFFSFIS